MHGIILAKGKETTTKKLFHENGLIGVKPCARWKLSLLNVKRVDGLAFDFVLIVVVALLDYQLNLLSANTIKKPH